METSTVSQVEIVLNDMEQNGSITSMEAFSKYGITRLSSIVYKLRRKGIQIDSVPCTAKNRYGNICNYAKYILCKEGNNEH